MTNVMRTIIKIDEEACDGCGLCIEACHEGALALIDGKARLIRDDYCDGLGDCLPVCPRDAIHFEKRLAASYDEAAVLAAQEEAKQKVAGQSREQAAADEAELPRTCAGLAGKLFNDRTQKTSSQGVSAVDAQDVRPSQLGQWPIQIKLVNTAAAYFDKADLLVAADCTAFSYGDFHKDFMTGKITIIGCPKLDEGDYTQKLSQIFSEHDLSSVTLARMEVPCCGGLERAVRAAIAASGKNIPLQVATITSDGSLKSVEA